MLRRGAHGIFLLLPALLAGCRGSIGDAADDRGTGSGERPGGADTASGVPGAGQTGPGNGSAAAGGASSAVSFACRPQATPPAQAWRRLSQVEYQNTMRDLLGLALKDANAAASIMGSLPLTNLPDETTALHGKYARMNQDVYQDYVRVWYQTAMAVGRVLSAPERIGVALGPCAKDTVTTNDADCLADFVRRFGERALRRPLTPEEVTFFVGYYGGGGAGVDPAGVTDVIAGLLMAPQFLYHVEHGEAAVAGRDKAFTLTAFELASRLSYQFWETMPDQQLWDAAKSGALKTPEGYTKELDRLFGDPRARKILATFYRQWLRVDEVPPLDAFNQDALFKTFAGLDLPTTKLRPSVIDDVMDMVAAPRATS